MRPTFYVADHPRVRIFTRTESREVAGWVGYAATDARGPIEDLVPIYAGATCPVLAAGEGAKLRHP